MTDRIIYRAVKNEIRDQDGKQVAVVLPTNCTMKLAREMAAFAAQQANHAEAQRKRAAAALRSSLDALERA